MKKIIILLLTVLIASCMKKEASKDKIFVSILPQKFFVEQISKKDFEIEVMVPPGMSPATYEPLPSQINGLSSAKAYFAIGVNFENAWLKKIKETFKELPVVSLDKGIEKLPMPDIHEIIDEHSHHEHEHGNLDPHIWLDPTIVKKIGRKILEKLIELKPEREEYYKENYNEFADKLDSLDAKLEKKLSILEDKYFLVFHPSWGYFAKRYGLKQIPLEIEGKEPSPSELASIIDYLKTLKIKNIFVQKQFSKAAINVITRELNVKAVEADPLNYNYFEELNSLVNKLSSDNE